MRTRTAALPLLLALCWVPEAAAQDPAAAEVERVRDAWIEAANRDDAAAVAALYADDATVVTAAGEVVRGREAIERMWAEGFGGVDDTRVTPSRTGVSGDLAFDAGEFRQTVHEGVPAPARGRYIVVLRRQEDGSWRIVEHISAVPPPEGHGEMMHDDT